MRAVEIAGVAVGVVRRAAQGGVPARVVAGTGSMCESRPPPAHQSLSATAYASAPVSLLLPLHV